VLFKFLVQNLAVTKPRQLWITFIRDVEVMQLTCNSHLTEFYECCKS